MIRPLLFVGLAACSTATPPAAPPPPAQAGSATTRWITPRAPQDATLLRLPARIEGDPARIARLTPLATGRIERVVVRPGDRVSKGAVVAELHVPSLIRAAADLRDATRRLRPVRARGRELRRLRKEGFAASDQTWAVRRDRASIESQAAHARAELRAAGIDPAAADALAEGGVIALRSPIDGVVRALDVRVGEVRGPGDPPIGEIVAAGAPRVRVRLMHPLPAGATLRFESPAVRFALGATPVASVGLAEGIGRQAWFEPADPVEALDGLRGEVVVGLSGADLVEVPQSAVIIEGGAARIAIRVGDATRWVDARVLTSSGATTVIRAALPAGAQVAADARRVRASAS